MHKHIKHLKRHRNVLYGVVVILLALQIISFLSVSSQISKVTAQQEGLNSDVKDINEGIRLLKEENQFAINTLTQELVQQRKDIQGEIDFLKDSQGDFSAIIEKVIPSVVSVVTERSSGSGFVIRENGYVLTNLHVIHEARQIQILTFEGERFNAVLVWSDSFSDLALLKVEGAFQKILLGDSDSTQIGEKVIAIGNPLGLQFTVTEGIVSAVDRRGPNNLEVYIQTDVTLNPGNSGGPLINKKGEVVGINNFKIGGAEGLGFALESNYFKDSVNNVISGGI